MQVCWWQREIVQLRAFIEHVADDDVIAQVHECHGTTTANSDDLVRYIHVDELVEVSSVLQYKERLLEGPSFRLGAER